MEEFWKTLNKTCARLGIKPTSRIVFVSIAAQTLRLFDDGKLMRGYAISTSARPPSNIKDSLGTPRGLHEIAERIGDGQPSGMVFKSRKPTGQLFNEETHPPAAAEGEARRRRLGVRHSCAALDRATQTTATESGTGVPHSKTLSRLCDAPSSPALITTRILWLRGLEPGVNLGGDVDSHARYIYIHGTNREDQIGVPQSAGCVVMRNLDIIDLFAQVRAGDMVLIG